MQRSDAARKTSSESGNSSSSKRSLSSLSPEERELTNELRSRQLSLAGLHSGSTSSSGSEPRDKLQAAEAAERAVEAARSSAARKGYSDQKTQSQGSSSNSQAQRKSQSEHVNTDGSASETGDPRNSQLVNDLLAKVRALEAALLDRDAQAAQMILDCTNIDSLNQERLLDIQEKLAAAVGARKAAEDVRDEMEVKAAGDKAKNASSLSAAQAEQHRIREMHQRTEAKSEEINKELQTAQEDLRKSKQRAEIDSHHEAKAQELSNSRVDALEALLQKANDQLAQLRRQKSSGTTTSSEREAALQTQIDDLIAERTRNRQDMSEARLELLGLKKRQALSALDERPEPGPPRRGAGRSRGGRGRGMLEIIDEDGGFPSDFRVSVSIALSYQYVDSIHIM